jgi:hypothetical protein
MESLGNHKSTKRILKYEQYLLVPKHATAHEWVSKYTFNFYSSFSLNVHQTHTDVHLSGMLIITHSSCLDHWLAQFSLTHVHKGGLKEY